MKPEKTEFIKNVERMRELQKKCDNDFKHVSQNELDEMARLEKLVDDYLKSVQGGV
jgi:hypothetical protein